MTTVQSMRLIVTMSDGRYTQSTCSDAEIKNMREILMAVGAEETASNMHDAVHCSLMACDPERLNRSLEATK